ncbi:MAG: hypothetical protein WC477_06160 [Patescibacteria group bacterium]
MKFAELKIKFYDSDAFIVLISFVLFIVVLSKGRFGYFKEGDWKMKTVWSNDTFGNEWSNQIKDDESSYYSAKNQEGFIKHFKILSKDLSIYVKG